MPGIGKLTASQNDKLSDIIRIFNRDITVFQEHFREIEDAYNYLAGIQFSKAQYKWYEEIRRPARTFNLIFPIFNQVLGDFLLNNQNHKVFPLPGGTNQIAMVYQKLIDHANVQNDIESVHLDTALAGIAKAGFFYPRFSDEKELDGSLVITNIDEFEIMWDPASQDYFLDDAQYVIRTRWMSKDDILRYWPQHRSELEQILKERLEIDWENTGSVPMDAVFAFHNRNFVNEKDGKYRIIEFREMEYDETEVAINPMTGQSMIFDLEGKKADLFFKVNPNVRIVRRRDRIKKITNIIPGLFFLLDEKKADVQDRTHDYIPFCAYHYGQNSLSNFGVFRNAKDPQDDFNSWRNQSNALINKFIDPGFIYKPEHFENPEDIENYGSMPGVNIKVDSERTFDEIIRSFGDYLTKLPFAPEKMSIEAAEFLQKVTNVTNNMQGVSETANEPASLFAQRVNRAMVALQTLYYNWSRSKRRLYNKAIRIMQTNYTTERYFLITNPKTQTQEELIINWRYGDRIINDIRVGRYEVSTDQIDNHPTSKFARFRQKTEIIQTIQALFGGQAIPPGAILPILSWWLEDSQLGDVQDFLQAIGNAIAEVSEGMQQQEALGITGAVMDLAQKRLDMVKGGLPERPTDQGDKKINPN